MRKRHHGSGEPFLTAIQLAELERSTQPRRWVTSTRAKAIWAWRTGDRVALVMMPTCECGPRTQGSP